MARLSRTGVPNADERLAAVFGCAETTQKQKGGDGEDSGGEGAEGGQKLKKKGEELKAEMDALVDEIDDVLEENAEEFVKNYVQRGGE
jgi:ubiquitin-like protein Pup